MINHGYTVGNAQNISNGIAKKEKMWAEELRFVVEVLEVRVEEEKANILQAGNDTRVQSNIASQISAMEKALSIYRAEINEYKKRMKDELIADMRKSVENNTLRDFLKTTVSAIDRNDEGIPTFIQIAHPDDVNETIEYEVGSGYIWYTRESQLNGEEALASSLCSNTAIAEAVCAEVDKLFADRENKVAYESRNVMGKIKDKCTNILSGIMPSEAKSAGHEDQPTDVARQLTLSFVHTDEWVEANATKGDNTTVVALLKGLKGIEYLIEGLPETIVEQIEDRNDKETIIQVLDRNVKRRAENKAMHQNKVNNL